MTHLTGLYMAENSLHRLPADIGRLRNLVHLDVSNNKLRSLPPEIGELIMLKELLLNNNHLRTLPFELGRCFQLTNLGKCVSRCRRQMTFLIISVSLSLPFLDIHSAEE